VRRIHPPGEGWGWLGKPCPGWSPGEHPERRPTGCEAAPGCGCEEQLWSSHPLLGSGIEVVPSTAHPTDPCGDPPGAQGGGSSKLAPAGSLPAPAPVCSSARRRPQLRTSPRTSSSWKGGRELPALVLPRASSSWGPCPPLRTLPGPQLHGQESQRGHADDGREQPGQDGEDQEMGESCGQRGDGADPRGCCRLGETRGGSGSPGRG